MDTFTFIIILINFVAAATGFLSGHVVMPVINLLIAVVLTSMVMTERSY